jgi:FixJ family two-component response regulator
MENQKSIIYVVDDDPTILEAIDSLARSIGLDTRCFTSAIEFLDAVHERSPGCVILDVRMPEMSGLEVQEKLSEINEHIPIIFISGHGDIPMAVDTLKKGAIDFLTKPFREEDILNAIRLGLKRDRQDNSAATEMNELNKLYKTLSSREREIFPYIVQGYLNKQTAIELRISEATVKVHRHNIMKKMGASSIQELVRIAEKLKQHLKSKNASGINE